MRFLSAADVEAVLDLDDLVDVVAAAMADLSAGRVSMPARIAALVPERQGLLAVMPAHLPSANALTTKLVSLSGRLPAVVAVARSGGKSACNPGISTWKRCSGTGTSLSACRPRSRNRTSAGGFNPDTNAERFTGDNETGLNIKIRKLGHRFAYVGGAVTHHMIPAARMTQRYLNSRLADQGFCDSYTDYRAIHPGAGRLARRIAAHVAFAGASALKAGARRIAGDSRWRIDWARIRYHRNRARYDSRLMRHEEWRAFALRDDWITRDSTAAG